MKSFIKYDLYIIRICSYLCRLRGSVDMLVEAPLCLVVADLVEPDFLLGQEVD